MKQKRDEKAWSDAMNLLVPGKEKPSPFMEDVARHLWGKNWKKQK